jgi:hypothetical protein
MAELVDNSGPYNPNRKFEDFSKEFLIKLLKAYMSAYTLADGFWNTEVRKTGKLAEEDIINCEVGVWRSLANSVQRNIAKLTNIRLPVKDVVEALKIWQIQPESNINPDIYLAETDIKDNNHVILTIVRCRSLEWFEEHTPERIEPICHRIEVPIMKAYCHALHPDMTVQALKLPPRESRDEIACKWEIKLEPKAPAGT